MTLYDSLLASMANPDLAEEMYQRYQENPQAVDEQWRNFFQQFDNETEEKLTKEKAPPRKSPAKAPRPKSMHATPPTASMPLPTASATSTTTAADPTVVHQVASGDMRVFNLLRAYRTYGHLLADINPIATEEPEIPYALKLETLGFSEDEEMKYFPTCGLLEKEHAPLKDIVATLQEIYCQKIGIEYMNMENYEMETWLQERIEPTRFKVNLTIEQKQMILQNLNKSELFESFLHTKYVGQKRFSLEGGETLIPMLSAVIEGGAELGMEQFVIGMAHRGRLNVLSNIMNKSYSNIFSEFEESLVPDSFEGSGDVKYHKGYTAKIQTSKGHEVIVELADNPSHLEAVNAVVEGMARAKQIKADDDVDMKRVTPILIHGDAAVAGQGVVYETLQLGGLAGYGTGGTIHIVINNQIGFTTLPKDSRSTMYCTDISRAFSAPVFHVNAEDPEGCVYATNLAVQLRNRFQCDVFIDLNCYRKYGHNEGDEPAFTQPLQYQRIRKKKPIREIYRASLVSQGVLEKYMAEVLEEEFKTALSNALKGVKGFQTEGDKPKKAKKEKKKVAPKNILAPVNTTVSADLIRKVAEKFCTVPKGFNINRKVDRLQKQRLEMVDDLDETAKHFDWGMAEHLAFATLLWEGVHIRISGQDSRRGTFSHRHAMWMDQKEEKKYFPLNHLKKDQGRFDVFNSPLSEFAVLGFEFGYSLSYPEALVIWEAQFGDFSNGAQIIIDQFVATAEQKWGDKFNMAMFLPHGYEGQGPEHSSARMERFLQLCGNDSMIVVYPSTPAQLFHLLRRQVLNQLYKPLIVFTPKGLLRHPECVSSMDDLTKGSFEEIIPDPNKPKKTSRLLICSGRVYYDLMMERKKREVKDVAIVRVEQLYPFHSEKMKKILSQYSAITECFWVQEEPQNMGAWAFIRPLIRRLLPKEIPLSYVGRERSASPAAGSHALHQKEYNSLMNAAFASREKQLHEMTYNSIGA